MSNDVIKKLIKLTKKLNYKLKIIQAYTVSIYHYIVIHKIIYIQM